MKVVLFCGGLGLRLRDYSDKIPKPLVPIGGRPILWHIMKYYATQGHRDFILCLGYRGADIKAYFLEYHRQAGNDFLLLDGSRVEPLGSDIEDWRISFVETGLHTSIGQRLRMVRPHLAGERYFLANYSDTLTDLPLNGWLERFTAQDKVASMMCVRPHLSLHSVELDPEGNVGAIRSLRQDLLVNGGYFVFREDIFEYIDRGEDLVEQPFARLCERQLLLGHAYGGFWATMDTFKDRQALEDLYGLGRAPWEVWKYRRAGDERRYAAPEPAFIPPPDAVARD